MSDPKHGAPAELVEAMDTKGKERNALVLESFVCLMTAHWPKEQQKQQQPKL